MQQTRCDHGRVHVISRPVLCMIWRFVFVPRSRMPNTGLISDVRFRQCKNMCLLFCYNVYFHIKCMFHTVVVMFHGNIVILNDYHADLLALQYTVTCQINVHNVRISRDFNAFSHFNHKKNNSPLLFNRYLRFWCHL